MRYKYSLLLISLILLLSQNIKAQEINILFLGNSYTYANNLPQMLSDLSSSSGYTVYFESNTPGGCTLDQHSKNSNSLNLIRKGNWDYVVLQEQSQMPSIDFYRYNSMYPAVERLCDSIRKYNNCATVVNYLTWGRQNGGKQCENYGMGLYCSADFVDFYHMQDSLTSAYCGIAYQTGAIVSPVGESWRTVLHETDVVLHSGDQSHPSLAGTYVAACTFYSTIWQESSIGLPNLSQLDDETVAQLQEIVDRTVFENAEQWNFNNNSLTADFSYTIDRFEVQFTNTSINNNIDSYLWSFGDGEHSTEENPVHTYAESGTYDVSLKVSDLCGQEDEKTQQIVIEDTSGSTEYFEEDFLFYPNPIENEMTIEGTGDNIVIEVINSQGVTAKEAIIEGNTISFANLSSGIYFIKIHDMASGKISVKKVVKK